MVHAHFLHIVTDVAPARVWTRDRHMLAAVFKINLWGRDLLRVDPLGVCQCYQETYADEALAPSAVASTKLLYRKDCVTDHRGRWPPYAITATQPDLVFNLSVSSLACWDLTCTQCTAIDASRTLQDFDAYVTD